MWTRNLTNKTLLEQADEDQKSITQSMYFVNLSDHTSIKVFDQGQGEPIIFVPTIPELHFVYASQLEEFSKSHRVILYDPQLSRKSFTRVSDRAHELTLLIEALGLKNAHIAAWSDAGSVAYHLAKESPDKCKSVMFLGLADEYKYPEPLRFLSKALLNFHIESFIPHYIVARIMSKYLSGVEVKPEWIVRRAIAIDQWTQYVKYSILPCMVDHKPKLGEVTAHCLVVCGDNDALVSVEQARRMASLLPKAGEAVIVPNGEHMLTLVNAQAVNKTMHDFYATLST